MFGRMQSGSVLILPRGPPKVESARPNGTQLVAALSLSRALSSFPVSPPMQPKGG